MSVVLDAGALIAFLKDEEGAAVVESVIANANAEIFVHALNMCEVYYDFHREYGKEGADSAVDALTSIGIEVREDLDAELWRQAGIYKANLRRIALADCFCLALAGRLNAEVVTADRHEFEVVSEQGIRPIRFIR